MALLIVKPDTKPISTKRKCGQLAGASKYTQKTRGWDYISFPYFRFFYLEILWSSYRPCLSVFKNTDNAMVVLQPLYWLE